MSKSIKIIELYIFSGDTLTLNCRVDQEWSICVWSHEIEDQTVSRLFIYYDNLTICCESKFLINMFVGFPWQ